MMRYTFIILAVLAFSVVCEGKDKEKSVSVQPSASPVAIEKKTETTTEVKSPEEAAKDKQKADKKKAEENK